MKFDQETWTNHLEFSKTTMGQLARRLGICLGSNVYKVADETGIEGNYQVAFDCPVPRPQRQVDTGAADTVPSEPDGGNSLTRSLDALGLKLEKRRVMQDVYVIDHVNKPSEN